MKSALLEKWIPVAIKQAEPLDKLPLPLHVLCGEAVDLARFFERHWTSEVNASGKMVRPGLELAERDGQFTKKLGREILELQEALSAAQTEYLLTVSKEPETPMARAEFVLGELQATLTYLFDDGVEDDSDVRLATLIEQHRQAFSQDARAAALDDYAGLAERHRAQLKGLGGFDSNLIDEARDLAKRLREQSASKLAGLPASEQKAALDRRNRIAALLVERMGRVRAAARFVFRNDPDLVRKVTSNYERKRRASSRKARDGQGSDGTDNSATG